MKIINGNKYSRGEFEGYKRRLILEAKKDDTVLSLNIYTTNEVVEEAFHDLWENKGDKVRHMNIVHWATKEQDDKAAEIIDEWLNE